MISNTGLIYYLRSIQKNSSLNDQQKKRQASVTITIIAMTLIFILLTMPATLVAAYYNELVTSYKGQVLLVAGDSCGFSYHALSIIILSVTNKRFFRKLKGIFYTKPEIHLNTIGLHDTTL